MSSGNLIIIGAGETAEIAYEYFTHDSQFNVVAFAVDRQYLYSDTFLSKPLIAIDELVVKYPPDDGYVVFVAISYGQLNRQRERLFNHIQYLGYGFASYISSKAFVWGSVKVGVNCMILENNVIQHGVVIEDNCFLWSGNHIGHRSIIKKSAYISSHVVISGYCTVGARSFLGVNSVCADQISLAEDSFLAAGAVVHSNTEPAGVYIGNPAKKKDRVTSLRFFKVKNDI